MNALLFWSLLLTVCAFVLFVQTLLVVRTIIVARLSFVRYLLVIIVPLVMSIWAFVVSLSGYQANVTQSVMNCQIMIGITILFIVTLALVERKVLPSVARDPLWVTMRERRWTR